MQKKWINPNHIIRLSVETTERVANISMIMTDNRVLYYSNENIDDMPGTLEFKYNNKEEVLKLADAIGKFIHEKQDGLLELTKFKKRIIDDDIPSTPTPALPPPAQNEQKAATPSPEPVATEPAVKTDDPVIPSQQAKQDVETAAAAEPEPEPEFPVVKKQRPSMGSIVQKYEEKEREEVERTAKIRPIGDPKPKPAGAS